MSPEEIIKSVKSTKRAVKMINDGLNEKLVDNKQHELIFYREKLLSLLSNSTVFKRFDIEPALARGAIAELMFEKIAEIWLKERGIEGQVISNIMLKQYPYTPEREDTTQLDVIVLTKRAIIVAECKSYFGKLETDGELLVSSSYQCKPWKQNYGHVEVLKNNLRKHLGLTNIPTIYNVVFVFSVGKFTNWTEPDSPTEMLMVPMGSWARLDGIYKSQSNDVLTTSDLKRIEDFCYSNQPSIEEEEMHIARLQDFM